MLKQWMSVTANRIRGEITERASLIIWLLTFVVWLAWLLWLFQFPLQISTDDALFFSRGVERFSVLELRPHFPGYPAFIALAWIFNFWQDAATSVIIASIFSAAAIPWLLIILYQEITMENCRRLPLVPAFLMLLCVLQPLLTSIALSGLSDATGLALTIASLIMIYRKHCISAGILMGLMLAARPSFFPIAGGLILCIPLIPTHKSLPLHEYLKIYGKGILGVTIVLIPTLFFLLTRDGLAFFTEGTRFTQGHFQIWGNTVASQLPNWQQWLAALTRHYSWLLLPLLSVSLLSAWINKHLRPLATIILIYLIWILLAQNPDNMRHFAPVALLWLPILTLQLSQSSLSLRRLLLPVTLGIAIIVFVTGASLTIQPAPIQQAANWLKVNVCSGDVKLTGTNYGVNLLREALPNCQVYDMYYQTSEIILKNNRAFRLSGTRQSEMTLSATFPARFIGERTLYLYHY